LKLSE